jgi:hypothetical protein
MATAMVFPDLVTGIAEKVAITIEAGKVEELSADEVKAAILACDFLRNLFSMARRSIEDGLRGGVDAKAFAIRYERGVADLDRVLAVVARVLTKARTSRLPALAEAFVSNYQALGDEMADLRQFLAECVAKAKAPVRPVDFKRVQEAEEAYVRGETRPFRSVFETRKSG